MLLGSPGVGKGTQAQFICNQYHVPQISTGDILRAAIQSDSELGREVKACIDRGELVPDNLICTVVKERLAQADCANGFLLDGFPRTIPQAEALANNNILLDYVIVLEAPAEEIIKRLSGRRIDPISGRTSNIYFQPPVVAGKDNVTGATLVQRDDDQEEVVRHRFVVYEKQTAPLIAYYRQQSKRHKTRLAFVSGMGDIEAIKTNILNILKG